MTIKYNVIVQKEEKWYVAKCLDNNVASQGKTIEEALQNLKVPYELVGFSEIDKFAIKSYCAIHNEEETKNLGDIKLIKTNNLKQIDFMTWRISLSRY